MPIDKAELNADPETLGARVLVYDLDQQRLWDKTFINMDTAVEYFQGVSEERGFEVNEHYLLLKVVGEIR